MWDVKKIFGDLPKQTEDTVTVAVLTRATIRINRLKNFWKNVNAAASGMATASGFILSYGIGEVPWIKQATFSVWQNKESMKAYAYKMQTHADVIKKTRKENWYKEELFVRFQIINVKGFDENTRAKLLNLHPL